MQAAPTRRLLVVLNIVTCLGGNIELVGRYVGSSVSGKMLSFDGATGSPGWEIDTGIPDGPWSPASIGANHVLYFVADDANLHAIAAVPVSR